MCLPPTQSAFLLTYLLTLSKAIPSPPTLPTPTLNITNVNTSHLNSTLAAVIPNFFQIIPSAPLDEPVLSQRYTFAITMHALERLALDDFEAEQGSQTWRSPHHAVAIDIVGPALDIESALARRKYAIWGIYKAVHLMVATGDFRCRNYELYWRGGLVGWVGYNNGLGMGGGMKNFTRDSVEEGSSLILPNTSRNVTTDSVGVDGVTFSFELHGRTIGESNVFMILFTAILKAAPFPKDERVRSFVVSGRPFNSYLSFMERLDPGPDGPFLKYEQVIQIFMQLPRWMISHGSQWSEANMVVLVDDRLVGTGVLVWQFRGEMGTVDGDTVTTS